MSRSRAIGTRAETAAARWLRTAGFPHAERRALGGAVDCGDLITVPALAVEVKGGNAAKAAGPVVIRRWMAETERERVNARADIGLLIVQRVNADRPGPAGWDAWLSLGAVAWLAGHDGRTGVAPPWPDGSDGMPVTAPVRMTFADAVTLLRRAGFGAPLDERPDER